MISPQWVSYLHFVSHCPKRLSNIVWDDDNDCWTQVISITNFKTLDHRCHAKFWRNFVKFRIHPAQPAAIFTKRNKFLNFLLGKPTASGILKHARALHAASAPSIEELRNLPLGKWSNWVIKVSKMKLNPDIFKTVFVNKSPYFYLFCLETFWALLWIIFQYFGFWLNL
jgi:hypothetical protein